jgi:putative addiction module component (TIGR02574 family)
MVDVKEILQLSMEEKIQIVDSIWDSIELEQNDTKIPLPEWQVEEINRRLEDFELGKSKTYTWEEVKAYAKEGL